MANSELKLFDRVFNASPGNYRPITGITWTTTPDVFNANGTGTNGCIPIVALGSGAGSGARVGLKVQLKSIHVRASYYWVQSAAPPVGPAVAAPPWTAASPPPALRMLLFMDRNANTTATSQPAQSDVLTNLNAVEQVNAPMTEANLGRFKLIRSKELPIVPLVSTGQSALATTPAGSATQLYYIDEYVRIPSGLDAIVSFKNNTDLFSYSNNGYYLAFVNNANANGNTYVAGNVRIRYTDQ